MSTDAGNAAPAQGSQRAYRARGDPRLGADLARRDLAPGRHLEAHRLARAAVAARCRTRARDGRRARAARATARSSSSRSPTPPSCSASTSARGSCAARSATCTARSAPARTSRSRASTPTAVIDAIDALRDALDPGGRPVARAHRRRRGRRAGGRLGLLRARAPGDQRARARGSRLRLRSAGAPRAAADGRERHQPRRARRAVAGRRARASTTSCSSRSAPASAPASCCAASCTRDATAPRASSTTRAPAGARRTTRARAPSLRTGSASSSAERTRRSSRPTTRARSSPPPAAATRSRRPSSRRRRGGSRCTSCPVAAVADVALVVLGGGIGANGDLLLGPVRSAPRRLAPVSAARRGLERSARPRCSPARSSVGVHSARENVFANRVRLPGTRVCRCLPCTDGCERRCQARVMPYADMEERRCQAPPFRGAVDLSPGHVSGAGKAGLPLHPIEAIALVRSRFRADEDGAGDPKLTRAPGKGDEAARRSGGTGSQRGCPDPAPQSELRVRTGRGGCRVTHQRGDRVDRHAQEPGKGGRFNEHLRADAGSRACHARARCGGRSCLRFDPGLQRGHPRLLQEKRRDADRDRRVGPELQGQRNVAELEPERAPGLDGSAGACRCDRRKRVEWSEWSEGATGAQGATGAMGATGAQGPAGNGAAFTVNSFTANVALATTPSAVASLDVPAGSYVFLASARLLSQGTGTNAQCYVQPAGGGANSNFSNVNLGTSPDRKLSSRRCRGRTLSGRPCRAGTPPQPRLRPARSSPPRHPGPPLSLLRAGTSCRRRCR